MILTLEVTAALAAQLGPASRKTFRATGGVIGRDRNSDWVLPNSKVSGRHARISCVDTAFYIEDTSRNGVFLNSTTNRLAPGRPHRLKSGDRILIEPYEIHVSITAEPGDAVRAAVPERFPARSAEDDPGRRQSFDADDPFGPPFPSSPPTPPRGLARLDAIAEALPDEELDPLKLLNATTPKRQPVRKAPSASDLEHSSPLAAHYRPPAVISPPAPPTPPPRDVALIPEDYDPLAPDLPPLESAPTPPPRARPIPVAPEVPDMLDEPPALLTPPVVPVAPPIAPTSAVDEGHAATPQSEGTRPPTPDLVSDTSLAAVLAGAGLDGVRATPELAEHFGQILRVVVSGVMDVLRARHQIKDEFRMRVTHFKVADNNPLKFSANIDDALHNLLVKQNEAYLAPVEAFDDAFEDLRHHQIALLTGMRVAFEFMLGEFDPDRLQKRFDRQTKKGSLLGMPAKLRYWELYRDRYEEIAKDPEMSFRKLFGEAFAKAYEEQLERLKGRPDNEKH